MPDFAFELISKAVNLFIFNSGRSIMMIGGLGGGPGCSKRKFPKIERTAILRIHVFCAFLPVTRLSVGTFQKFWFRWNCGQKSPLGEVFSPFGRLGGP